MRKLLETYSVLRMLNMSRICTQNIRCTSKLICLNVRTHSYPCFIFDDRTNTLLFHSAQASGPRQRNRRGRFQSFQSCSMSQRFLFCCHPFWPHNGCWFGWQPHEPAIEEHCVTLMRTFMLPISCLVGVMPFFTSLSSLSGLESGRQITVVTIIHILLGVLYWLAFRRLRVEAQPRNIMYAMTAIVSLVAPTARRLLDPVGFGDILPVVSRRLVFSLCCTQAQWVIFGVVSVPVALMPMVGCIIYMTRWCFARRLEALEMLEPSAVFFALEACVSVFICLLSALKLRSWRNVGPDHVHRVEGLECVMGAQTDAVAGPESTHVANPTLPGQSYLGTQPRAPFEGPSWRKVRVDPCHTSQQLCVSACQPHFEPAASPQAIGGRAQ